MTIETVGYLGSVFLAINAIPELIRTVNDRRCHIGWPMLIFWALGEICMTAYSLHLSNIPLMLNYIFNLIIVIVMLYYKFRPMIIDDVIRIEL